MGKYKAHRQPRGRRFDNFDSEPSYFHERAPVPKRTIVAETAQQVSQDVELLWFNAEKGFGFVRLSDGSDAFIHGTKLRAAGYNNLPSGASLSVHIEVAPKGPQVAEVLSVPVVDEHVPVRPEPVDQTADVEPECPGVVKRYDAEKGFGFITLNDGDAFVHAKTLTRCAVSSLEPGQKVSVSLGQGRKGLEVRSIRPR